MNLKLYQGFALIAMASAIVALVRLAFGQPVEEVVPPNIVIGGICFVVMLLLIIREKRKLPNGT